MTPARVNELSIGVDARNRTGFFCSAPSKALLFRSFIGAIFFFFSFLIKVDLARKISYDLEVEDPIWCFRIQHEEKLLRGILTESFL